ncbi:uncharacterized protein LOC122857995 isoform X2 [Aphidius gifuensis]|nr:uncharacterized protein LOC122857995 isoform X2 [Aphidius gifuensis]
MTRCGVICGLAALVALTTALLGPAWLHTEEQLTLPHLPRQFASAVTVRFKLGLFKVCPTIIKPPNITFYVSTPGCTKVRYNNFADVASRELGFNELNFTPLVVSKMRISAPFQIAAVVLISLGTFFAMIGHCYGDHKTIIACGLYLLGGLSLGGGLIVLASALSDASFESPKRYGVLSSLNLEDNALPQYKYGWCLQLSGLALILAEIAALFTVSGYMARFPTVEDMVRVMVPGAERKLREQRGLSSEYLVRSHQKSPGVAQTQTFDQPTKDVILGPQRLTEEGTTSLLCKTAPDICVSNPKSISYVDKNDLSHILPSYPNSQIVEPQFTFVDKIEPGIVDSRLSGFADKEGFMDSRILSDSRQNIMTYTEDKEHVLNSQQQHQQQLHQQQLQQQQQLHQQQQLQESRYVEFCNSPRMQEQCSNNDTLMSNVIIVSDTRHPMTNNEYLHDNKNYNCCNNLAGQTVPIILKHNNQNQNITTIQSHGMYQNFGTIHSGRCSEPSTSTSTNTNQRSMTLQNPKRKNQIGQNTFSTLECEKRGNGQKTSGHCGKIGFYAGSAV